MFWLCLSERHLNCFCVLYHFKDEGDLSYDNIPWVLLLAMLIDGGARDEGGCVMKKSFAVVPQGPCVSCQGREERNGREACGWHKGCTAPSPTSNPCVGGSTGRASTVEPPTLGWWARSLAIKTWKAKIFLFARLIGFFALSLSLQREKIIKKDTPW